MSQERITELTEALFLLERRIRPLEWDASKNQINEFRRQQLDKLRTEHASLKEELAKLSIVSEE